MMATPSADPTVFPSPIDQLSSLLSLSQQIRTAANSGQIISKEEVISKLDAILPCEPLSPPPFPSHHTSVYKCSTPIPKHHNDFMTSTDSGLALNGSFSSLYESDEGLFSPHTPSNGRRANRSLPSRPSSAKNLRNERNKHTPPPDQDAQMYSFLQTVSSEFSTSLRALLENMDRQADKRQDDLNESSDSDVTLPEVELVQGNKDVNQLIGHNSALLNTCKQLKARMREERSKGKKVRRENTNLLLERDQLLSKMSETEREIIEKLSEHGTLMESYSELEERMKERDRTLRETEARITAMEMEVNNLTELLSRVQQNLSESTQREEEYQRENIHLQEDLVLKENEVIELKSAAQRVQSHAQLLSSGGVVSSDEILRDTASLCDQLNTLTNLLDPKAARNISQIRTGLSHALTDGNILLQNIAVLKHDHEHCKETLTELQQKVKGISDQEYAEDMTLLERIAEMVPLLKVEAEQLVEQWGAPVNTREYEVNCLILSHLRELLTEHTGREVTNESLIASLSAVLASRDRGRTESVCSLKSESAELEGKLQESSLLLSSMSVALNGEQTKRRYQVRALKRKIIIDKASIDGLQSERDSTVRSEQLIRCEISRLCENLKSDDVISLSLGVTEPCVLEVAELIGKKGNVPALESSLKSAYDKWDKTTKLLELKLSENEEYSDQVRRLTMDRLKVEGVNAELQTCVLKLEEQLIAEREDSETRENLLRAKLKIVHQHIQKYDDVMFAELNKLSDQVKDDHVKQDLQQRKEDNSKDVLKMKEEISDKQNEIKYLEKEVTVYKLQLQNLENSHKEEIDKLKESIHYNTPSHENCNDDPLPNPTPLSIPPMIPLRGEELRTALGVALTQEQLYAKAHLSLQTERDDLASENKKLRDRFNALHQHMTDPRSVLATSPLPRTPQGVSHEERRLKLENETLSNYVSELSTRVSKLSHYRDLYFNSKLKYSSLLWQKSYLKSQLNVYFSSLLASGLILSDMGVGSDKMGLGRTRRTLSKFRCCVWVVIFTHRLSHNKWGQQNILYLNYTPSSPRYIRRYNY